MEQVFRAGRLNKIPDYLSRYPVEDSMNKVCLAVLTAPNSRMTIAQNTDPF